MCKTNSRLQFWKSREVAKRISDAIQDLQFSRRTEKGPEPLEALRQQIIRYNNKTDSLVPPPLIYSGTCCLDQMPFPKDQRWENIFSSFFTFNSLLTC